MSQRPAVQALPPGLASLADHEAHAHGVLDDNAWAYFSGAAGDGITLRANRTAWDALALLPRVLQPLDGAHTRVQLLGRTLAHPILVAPVAYQRLAHPDGELATALAASAQGAGMVVSTQSSTLLEEVARAIAGDAQRGPLWFQLYLQSDRGVTRELVRRAEEAGYEALVLTVDAPVNGARDAERRAGFRLPRGIAAVNLPPSSATAQAATSLFEGLLATAPGWHDVEWLQSITRLPVLVKGILHPADARQAAGLNLAGVIVSNHGGRTLDTAPASARMLPRIADAVGGALPLLVDGGIRRGTDVLKAMAMGARAVLVGRPVVWGLANAGAVGAAHVLRLLRDELEIAMALCGVAALDNVPGGLLLDPVH
ncbi:MAG: alpha-hydroxy-acid oxidizing protein [Comamonadaceae bacterium]|nr:MAG: alpha-hydroxy-acid oxidizing protein [Comamonadaceae bacterium]